MKISDIKTLTIVGNNIIINDKNFEIELSLEDGIDAVQYHRGFKLLEEPKMEEVSFDKYQEFINLWEQKKEEEMLDFIKNQSTQDPIREKIREYKAYLEATDFKVLPDYDEDATEVKLKRKEAREFIRANEIKK